MRFVIALLLFSACAQGDVLVPTKHELLLDEVSWNFDQKVFDDPEKFHIALTDYNTEIGSDLGEEIFYSLDFNQVTIVFDYTELLDSKWVRTQKSVILKSSQDEFSEFELLYLLHNSIQSYFKDYDHSYHEGLELLENKKDITYELVLGS